MWLSKPIPLHWDSWVSSPISVVLKFENKRTTTVYFRNNHWAQVFCCVRQNSGLSQPVGRDIVPIRGMEQSWSMADTWGPSNRSYYNTANKNTEGSLPDPAKNWMALCWIQQGMANHINQWNFQRAMFCCPKVMHLKNIWSRKNSNPTIIL